tara:strand:- start:287 stop:493 length:207 start_codon:yes stop_codon:yes gene_type:complete
METFEKFHPPSRKKKSTDQSDRIRSSQMHFQQHLALSGFHLIHLWIALRESERFFKALDYKSGNTNLR